ncbi:MAG: phosphomannomutase/phosphoglucomutase [Candidatus Krumholzibacteriota bacterium]|nr:phosphomannomutase/phosphoglucomutase [Candidatus Krumholzibacteriota bacterium]
MPRRIFREYDIRGVVGEDLTAESYRALGGALAARFRADGATEAVVARDNRLHSPELHDALVAGLRGAGLDVLSIGTVPTPVLYYALAVRGAGGDCGAVVTASHNPPQYNGLKIVSAGRALSGADIAALRDLALAAPTRDAGAGGEGAYREEDWRGRYVDRIAAGVHLARPVRVALDCGNGTSGIVLGDLLAALGADAEILYEEPDGRFPNHPADPVVAENLADLIARVRAGGFELGIAFDGDSDRIGVVDEQGAILWGDRLLALYARDLLAETPGAKVIFEVKCSRALAEDIAAHGGTPILWKTGHSLIKAKMREEKALLAGEMSGHIFFGDRWFGFDDALYAAARLLEIVARGHRPLGDLLAGMPEYVSTPEIRLPCPDERKFEIVAALRDEFAADYEVVDIDGVRVEFPDGWGLVRASNTGPVLVLRFEAESGERLAAIQGTVMAALARHLPERG